MSIEITQLFQLIKKVKESNLSDLKSGGALKTDNIYSSPAVTHYLLAIASAMHSEYKAITLQTVYSLSYRIPLV